MPITKSAKKAIRQSERKRIRNLRQKREIKDLFKELRQLTSRDQLDKAKQLLPKYYKIVDKAAKKNLIKKRRAAKKKSKMAKLMAKSSPKK